ncbi:MAG: hypothetical protein U9Q35_10885 [Pseudomonadota bacterium]|nr:hypothetical protein [Pseudomonadota bacterium]
MAGTSGTSKYETLLELVDRVNRETLERDPVMAELTRWPIPEDSLLP